MMRLTPRQLKHIRSQYPELDENILLLAALYLQRNLSDDEFSNELPRFLRETFKISQSASVVVNELKQIIQKFVVFYYPTYKYTPFTTLRNCDAVTLSVRLLAHSAFPLIMSDEELAFAENPLVQAAAQLVERFFDAKNNPDPLTIIEILNKLFENFPELEHVSAFNDLMLQAQFVCAANQETILDIAKEKLNLQKKIGEQYLTDALAAFHHWKKQHNTHVGVVRKILQQTDKLLTKYPFAKKEILAFSGVMFQETLADKEALPSYFTKFCDIVNTLVNTNDKTLIYSLCHHLGNQNKAFNAWSLIEITSHPVFQQLESLQRQIILNIIAVSLNNDMKIEKADLRFILDRCQKEEARTLILKGLTGFYFKAPYPNLATVVEWIKPIAENDLAELHETLSQGFIKAKDPKKPIIDSASATLEKQLNKLRRDTDAYAHTSFMHTRKNRSTYLNMLSVKQLTFIDTKSAAEKQALLQQTIAELYLHYATIEDASGILSRTLEKRLIKLLQIPKDNLALKNAIEKRESFIYKVQTFFCAGRSFFKTHHDKAQDPVHAIILQHLNPVLIAQINQLQQERQALDELDQRETSWFNRGSISEESLTEIGESISRKM